MLLQTAHHQTGRQGCSQAARVSKPQQAERCLTAAATAAPQAEEGPIDAPKSVADVRPEPYALPKECAAPGAASTCPAQRRNAARPLLRRRRCA